MRLFLKWLMVFCVLTGLHARAVAADASHFGVCSHVEEVCCEHSHQHSPEDSDRDGQKCPQDHHHHGCCSTAQPLTVDTDSYRHRGIPTSSRLGVLREGEVAPEEPLLALEKPPLI